MSNAVRPFEYGRNAAALLVTPGRCERTYSPSVELYPSTVRCNVPAESCVVSARLTPPPLVVVARYNSTGFVSDTDYPDPNPIHRLYPTRMRRLVGYHNTECVAVDLVFATYISEFPLTDCHEFYDLCVNGQRVPTDARSMADDSEYVFAGIERSQYPCVEATSAIVRRFTIDVPSRGRIDSSDTISLPSALSSEMRTTPIDDMVKR